MLSKAVLEKARAYALAEIEKYGLPIPAHFEISEKMAKKIVLQLGGELDIVLLWVYLMDLKIGQAFAEKRLEQHIQMGAEAATIFLQQEWVDEETIDKIIHCILSHHGTIPYESLEAEICANADCYRFCHPTGFLIYMHGIAKRWLTFFEALDQAEKKLEEKHSILSLELCKNECENHYQKLTEYIALSRKELA